MKKSIFLFFATLLCASTVWGTPIYNIKNAYVAGTMNEWSANNTNWHLGSGNHCEKTFYVKKSDTNYKFKVVVDGSWYTKDGYWYTKDNSGPFTGLSTSGNDMQIETKNITTSTDYVALKFDFWGEYGGDSRLSVTQSAVSALSPTLTTTSTNLSAGETSTLKAACTGGSGTYGYTYKVTCGGSDVTSSTLNSTTGTSVVFTAPTASTEKTYTITVTAEDAHALLEGLSTKTATKTITVAAKAEDTNPVKVLYKCESVEVLPSTTIEVGVSTPTPVPAPDIAGYNFVNWTKGTGVNYVEGNDNTQSIRITTNTTGDYTLVANYTPETVYFVNTAKWSDVKVYAWKAGGINNGSYPGEALKPTGEKIDGYDVYKYTSGKGYENVIFNGNSGKTQDLAWTDGKYYVYNSKNSNNPDDWYEKDAVEGVLPRYKTIYLNTGGSDLWDQGDAKFFVHAWGGGADDIDAQMKPLENEIYQVEIAASQTGIIFTRQKPESANTALEGDLLWNKTNNRDIPADKNCYTITGWGGDDGTWSNLEYYVTGNKELVGGEGWKANEVKMAAGNGTWSHTFNSLEKGIEYQFKITRNGTWEDKTFSYQHLSKPIAENILGCKDDNIGFVLANTGDVTITFDGTNISLTTTSSFAVPVYTIVGVEKLTGHDWSVNAADNNMVQDPVDKNIYTLVKENISLAGGTYNYKVVRNHTFDWSVPNGSENKTLEITNSGKGTVTFTFDLSKLELTAKNDPWEAEIVAQEVKLHYNDGIVAFTEDDDHKKTFVSIDLAENTVYSFTISINDNHMFNPGIMWRENNEEWKFENATIGQEAHIVTDIAGTHTFTYTYETNKLTVTYPEGTNVPAPVFLGGGMNDWSWTSTRLLPTADGTKASVRLSLTEKTTTEFKIKEGDTMYGNDGTMDRNYHEGWIFSEKKQDSEEAQVNAKIYADITGQYIFTWDYATNTLSVEYPECPTIELDENNNSTILSQYDDKVVNVVLKRSFTANDGYYTICLPFDLKASEIGKAYQVDYITEHVAEQGFNMVFNEVQTLEAGQPYLIEPKEDLIYPTFENVTITYTGVGETVHAEGAGINFDMIGKINGAGSTNGLYWVGNNGYFYNDDTSILGLRTYFSITDNNGTPLNIRARVVVSENAATGLDNITNGENTTIKVIENGQLIIIRNGEKFNAQGQKL